MKKPYIIGIAGGSASGKTTLLKLIRAQFNDEQVCIISQDNYYRPAHFQQKDDNGYINFDLPEGIDDQSFLADIARLTNGESVEMIEYMFNQPGVQGKMITMKPAPVIVVEGIFIFYFPEIRNILDLKIYLDSSEDLKLARRLERDKTERGLEDDIILYQWHNHAIPSFHNYLLPYRDSADMVIYNNETFNEGLKALNAKISEASILKS